MRFRGALFDLDGTLLDTLDDLADSMNASLAREGFEAHPAAAYKTFVGDGMRMLARRALPEGSRDDDTVLRVMTGMREEYGRRWADRTRPYPGIEAMLDGLEARGVRKAVLSNKPDDFTRKCVEKLLPGRAFEVVRGVRDGTLPKPDPAGALEIASGMGLAPREFLYLGDTNTDMRTALAAGMFAVGALWGFRPERELREAGAQALVARPQDVLALFDC